MSRLAKYARWIGVAGSMGAVAWAMRDRFVSIAVPREPDRPVFRTPPTEVDQIDDLTAISGIGPVFARRLGEAGISSFSGLAAETDAKLAEILNIGESRTSGWREQADRMKN